MTDAEDRAMVEALRQGRRGVGTTHPNPRVGAVVLRGAERIAAGYHARAGEAHAEIRALDQAGAAAAGATLVVTLEPCPHVGRTPPCVDAILGAGIRRVVIGMQDPHPVVNGAGIRRLEDAGLDVVVGLREAECRELNPPYLKWRERGLPWVLLKSMVSLDGRIATADGESRGLGGEEEQRLVHRLRAQSDAIIVGVGTVLRDDPLLTVRLARSLGSTPARVARSSPLRVVLDSSLRTPLHSKLVATAREAPLLVVTTDAADPARRHELEARGVEVWSVPPDASGRVPLEPVLLRLGTSGRYALLVEGGPTVHTSFLAAGLADEVAVGIAPILLGGAGAPTWTGELHRSRIAEGIPVESMTLRRLGKDVWLSGRLKREAARANSQPPSENGHV